MVHQELNQALKRNVMDNIWLGRYPKIAGIAVNEKKMKKDTEAIFDELDINVDVYRIMGTMPVSQRQMVEIAKAVSYNSKVIVFDEPTSSLTEEEVEHLFKIINMLRDRGVGIIYISHKMAEIKRISDEITIMRDGQWVATEPAEKLEMNDSRIDVYKWIKIGQASILMVLGILFIINAWVNKDNEASGSVMLSISVGIVVAVYGVLDILSGYFLYRNPYNHEVIFGAVLLTAAVILFIKLDITQVNILRLRHNRSSMLNNIVRCNIL